jgi:hypothetical protein
MSVETGYYEPADLPTAEQEDRVGELTQNLLYAVEITTEAIIDEALEGEEEETDTDSIKEAAMENAADILRSLIRNYREERGATV